MMDVADRRVAPPIVSVPDPMGADGTLASRIIPLDELKSPSYSPLALFQDGAATPAPVIASCPHAGRDYPESLTCAAVLPMAEMRGLEDFGVDQLIAGLAAQGITSVVNRVARAYIDVNRPAGALDGAMFETPVRADEPSRQVSAGYGLIPRLTALRKPLYETALPASEIDRRLAIAHAPYHEMLRAQLAAVRAEHGQCLLIDVHSMPPRDRTNRRLADIILGDCLGTTLEPGLVDAFGRFFADEGLRIAWNEPYAGGHITRQHGRVGTASQSIQIEINRALYMKPTAPATDEPRMDPAGTKAVQDMMGRFGAFLVGQLANTDPA